MTSENLATGAAEPADPGLVDPATDRATDPVDLVVVGGGPAGLAGAATALAGGLRVTLVDAGASLGGQYWRHPAPGLVPVGAHLHHDLGTYTALLRYLSGHAARADSRLRVLSQHDVWTATRGAGGVEVHAVDRRRGPGRERAVVVRAAGLLIATGAFDRQIPFPGWDLPGVYTAGGLQALLKGNAVRAGSRVVVAGTGPFLPPVAAGLAQAGADVAAVCEANSPSRWVPHLAAAAALPEKGAEGAGYAARLVRHRISVRTSAAVVAAHGRDRLEAVTIATLDGDGAIRPGTRRRVVTDALGVGWGFVPQLDLAITLGVRLVASEDENQVVAVDADQRSSVPGVYVAGEATGVGGAVLALREGQLAGEAVLADAGRAPATPAGRVAAVRRIVARHRAFARALRLAHPVPSRWREWLTDDTLVCRCEEVTAGAVRTAVADLGGGAVDGRQVKQLTRVGMGWCQGRMCGYAAACLGRPLPAVAAAARPATTDVAAPADGGAAASRPIERLVAFPLPLGAIDSDSAM